MPADKPATKAMLSLAARTSVAEIYRQGDWRELTRQVDLAFQVIGNQRDEIAALRAEIAALKVLPPCPFPDRVLP